MITENGFYAGVKRPHKPHFRFFSPSPYWGKGDEVANLLTISLICGIISPTLSDKGDDGNEYARSGLAANPGRCEPGQTSGLKILPEPQAELRVSAPGTPPVIQASD